MARTSTVALVKSNLIQELESLQIESHDSEAVPYVQVTYGPPPAEETRNESVRFSEEMSTVTDPSRRLNEGRRHRFHLWELELEILTTVTSDTEDAEKRAFEIAGEIEDFLAENSQPREWPNNPVPNGALSVVVSGLRSELYEHVSGHQAVKLTLTLELNERLT